jgi:hypothetical protein
MGVWEEFRYCLPCIVAFAWIIGAFYAVLDLFLLCATTKITCAATGIHGIRLATPASEFLLRHTSQTGGKLVRATGFTVFSY